MLKIVPKKILISFFIFPILISLTSLGIRLPTIDGLTSGKPNPRPRAVLQTQVKKCKEQIECLSLDLPTRTYLPQLSLPVVLRHQSSAVFFPQRLQSITQESRAPPSGTWKVTIQQNSNALVLKG